MEPQMQQIKTYRFLVIGRIGDGKSSLCQFLTGLESIEVSSKIASCTNQCQLYRSIDKLNQQRGYAIQVLDTPGLDSNYQNMLKIVMQLADIFTKSKYLNGILYTVSMSHSRDETISWFLNFLRLYFSKQQLSKSIIPILTHYDKILFQDDEKVMEMKNSRKQAILKIWDSQQQVICFWENYLQWINDAKQKPSMRQNADFKNIYYSQLSKLIHKAAQIQLSLLENAKRFEQNLIKNLSQELHKSQGKYKMITQQIEPIKFKVNLKNLSFWKTLAELKSNFSKVLIGTIVVLGLKGYAHKKYKTYQKSVQQVDVGLFQNVKIGINKIMVSQFQMQFCQWITINTSSTDTVQDLNRVFSAGGMCHIHINLPKDSYYGIDTLELTRISPESKQPCILLPKKQKGLVTFQDCRRFVKEDERIYQFRNIKIIRPDDQFINETLTNLIRKK